MRRFLATIRTQIVLDNPYIAPLQRLNDEYLMPRIIQSGVFTDTDLHVTNCCRMYLDVLTVSDLTTASGTFIDAAILQHGPSTSSKSKYHKSIQEKLSNWEAWDRAVAFWFAADDAGRLYKLLGDWIHTGDRLRRHWRCYYDNLDTTVYYYTPDGYV